MTYKELFQLALEICDLDAEVVVVLGENVFVTVEAMAFEETKRGKRIRSKPVLELNDEALKKFVHEMKSEEVVDG